MPGWEAACYFIHHCTNLLRVAVQPIDGKGDLERGVESQERLQHVLLIPEPLLLHVEFLQPWAGQHDIVDVQ